MRLNIMKQICTGTVPKGRAYLNTPWDMHYKCPISDAWKHNDWTVSDCLVQSVILTRTRILSIPTLQEHKLSRSNQLVTLLQ